MHAISCCTCSKSIFPFLTNNILALRRCRCHRLRLCNGVFKGGGGRGHCVKQRVLTRLWISVVAVVKFAMT